MPNRTFLRYRAIKRNAATQKAAVYPEGLRMEAFLHVSAAYTAYRLTLPSIRCAQRTRRCFEATRECEPRQCTTNARNTSNVEGTTASQSVSVALS